MMIARGHEMMVSNRMTLTPSRLSSNPLWDNQDLPFEAEGGEDAGMCHLFEDEDLRRLSSGAYSVMQKDKRLCEDTMTDPKIRTAEVGDIPEIQRLYRQLDRHHAQLLPEFSSRWMAMPGNGCPREVDRSGRCRLLLAELDGRVVGFVNLHRSRHPGSPMFRRTSSR